MRIWRQPSPVWIMINKKLQHLEPFNYLSSLITSVARCTLEIKLRDSLAKSAWNKKKTLFISKSDLICNEGTNEKLHLGRSFVWCWKRVHVRKQIWNIWNDLKCGAGEGWRRSVGPIVWKMKKCYKESKKWTSYIQYKEGRLTVFVTSFIGTSF